MAGVARIHRILVMVALGRSVPPDVGQHGGLRVLITNVGDRQRAILAACAALFFSHP